MRHTIFAILWRHARRSWAAKQACTAYAETVHDKNHHDAEQELEKGRGCLDALVVVDLSDLILNPLIQELLSLRVGTRRYERPTCASAIASAVQAIQVEPSKFSEGIRSADRKHSSLVTVYHS